MSSPDRAGETGFDRGFLRRDMKFCIYAALKRGGDGSAGGELRPGIRTDGAFERDAVSASLFRRAGAHALLLEDADTAYVCFREAAQNYKNAAMPYAIVMDACARALRSGDFEDPDDAGQWIERYRKRYTPGEGDLSSSGHGEPSDDGFEPDRSGELPDRMIRQLSYVVLGWQASTHRPLPGGERLRSELEARQARPLGVLALPVLYHLQLADAFLDPTGDAGGGRRVREALFPFVSAYDGAVRQARTHRLHWSRALLPFHPAEPDIVGILRTADPGGEWISGWIEDLPIDRESAGLLQLALRTGPR